MSEITDMRREQGVGVLPPTATWTGVYKVGAVALLLTGLLYAVGAVLSMVIGPPPGDSELYLQSLARHASVARANFGFFALTDIMLVPGMLGLYLALRRGAASTMLISTALMILFAIVDLSTTALNSLTLIAVAGKWTAATGEAARSACVGAATYALATLPPSTFHSYFVSSVALVVISLVMVKRAGWKGAAYAGLVGSAEGIVGAFYVVRPSLAVLLIPSLLAFAVWSALAGAALWKAAADGRV